MRRLPSHTEAEEWDLQGNIQPDQVKVHVYVMDVTCEVKVKYSNTSKETKESLTVFK